MILNVGSKTKKKGDNMPTRKVGVGAIAGAVVAIGIWVASRYGVQVPGEIGSAMTLVVTGVASYWVSDPQ